MNKVLVAGATGYLGRYVVQAFNKRGYSVRALGRNDSKLKQLGDCVDESRVGLITKPETLSGVCDGVDIVFTCVGITKQNDNLTFDQVDYQGNLNLLNEAKKAGVSKFIFISVYNAHNMTDLKGVQAKIKFEQELKSSRLDYVIIYPNGFFSDMGEYLKMAQKGRGYLFGSGEFKINPIHGADLAELCVDAAENDQQAIDVGGPDLFTHNEIMQLAFETLNKKAKISHIPLFFCNLFLKILKAFTSVKTYGPIEFFVTVLTTDLEAPKFGQHHLKDFFESCRNI